MHDFVARFTILVGKGENDTKVHKIASYFITNLATIVALFRSLFCTNF